MNGIFVWLQLAPDNSLHPVSMELLGKAHELASPLGWQVFAGAAGSGLSHLRRRLTGYGVTRLFIADAPSLAIFRGDLYIAAAVAAMEACRPEVALFGATPEGRSIAPAAAVHFGTGLTADCTRLELTPEGGLVQVRPAFGGNLMAQIITPHTRPQMATVRPRVMDSMHPEGDGIPDVVDLSPNMANRTSLMEVKSVYPNMRKSGIAHAQVLVAIGKGVAAKGDIPMFDRLSELLGGQLASSRALVEKGWMPPETQIGLSGSSVRPRLLVTCGISGSVQFMAGAAGARHICAINSDPSARILSAAHTPVLGDIYQLVPLMVLELEKNAAH